MGYFGVFSAVLNGSSDAIAQFFKTYFKENITQVSENKKQSDLLVYPSDNNWVVIKWPRYYYSYGKTSDQVSKEFQTVVSAINVYDGDFWEHNLFKNGKEIDYFHSAPDCFRKIDSKSLKFIAPGNPQLIATELKIDVSKIKPYFNREKFWEKRPNKAFPEDIYELWDGLAFIDFWEKLGVRLPEDAEVPEFAFNFDTEFLITGGEKALFDDLSWGM